MQSRDSAGAAAVERGTKRRRQREHKPLRYDVVAAASKVRPVLRPPAPKRKAAAKAAAAIPSSAAGLAGRPADGAARDLWAEEPVKQSAADANFAEAAQLAVQALRKGGEGGVLPRAAKRRCGLSPASPV